METLDPQAGPVLTPEAWLAGFMWGTTRHCLHQGSSWALTVGRILPPGR